MWKPIPDSNLVACLLVDHLVHCCSIFERVQAEWDHRERALADRWAQGGSSPDTSKSADTSKSGPELKFGCDERESGGNAELGSDSVRIGAGDEGISALPASLFGAAFGSAQDLEAFLASDDASDDEPPARAGDLYTALAGDREANASHSAGEFGGGGGGGGESREEMFRELSGYLREVTYKARSQEEEASASRNASRKGSRKGGRKGGRFAAEEVDDDEAVSAEGRSVEDELRPPWEDAVSAGPFARYQGLLAELEGNAQGA